MGAKYIGIDTGGTFTDGVVIDPELHTIYQATKVLTTHHNLKLCITQVLDELIGAGDEDIRLVSLSTTLATNAIVEGKSRPVGLFLLGYDPELVYQYDFQRQFNTERYFFLTGGMDLQGSEQAPLDEAGLAAHAAELKQQVEAFAVSSYAGTLNASHEERAGALLHKLTGLPVVQGHHLTTRLNSIRRATTACLNAGLLSTAYDFVHTVEEILKQKGVHCPLVIVRGDGSLVSAGFAALRPVEIIHSGPATSAIGGLYLAGLSSALVVDIGGTTTDLALLQDGHPLMDGGEATVGGYHTSVRTIRARSFGLGGDSQIRFTPRGEISVGPERVIPLSYLAHTHPQVKRDLEAWLIAAPERFYSDKIEYWQFRRAPRQPFSDPRTNRAIELLQAGPLRLPVLLKQAGAVSTVQIDGAQLLRQDIISRAGLTPTDLLHVTGEYTPWDREVAELAVEAVARMMGLSPEEFIQLVRQKMTQKIVSEIIHFISGYPVPEESETSQQGQGSLARWMFTENLTGSDAFLGCKLQLKVPVVGIGAPAKAFLDPVAEALGCQVIYPQHYAIANAVGTVVGNVLVQKDFEVVPQVEGQMIVGYLAHTGGAQRCFETAAEALAFTRKEAAEQALREACAAGAVEPEVVVEEKELLGEMWSVSARAVGKPL
jgi:N-methylhydantoinase A/oxoprolinase/acetone carboxylase beta subunit